MLAAQGCGLLHRQELVSQLPAAVFGVRPEQPWMVESFRRRLEYLYGNHQ